MAGAEDSETRRKGREQRAGLQYIEEEEATITVQRQQTGGGKWRGRRGGDVTRGCDYQPCAEGIAIPGEGEKEGTARRRHEFGCHGGELCRGEKLGRPGWVCGIGGGADRVRSREDLVASVASWNREREITRIILLCPSTCVLFFFTSPVITVQQ